MSDLAKGKLKKAKFRFDLISKALLRRRLLTVSDIREAKPALTVRGILLRARKSLISSGRRFISRSVILPTVRTRK